MNLVQLTRSDHADLRIDPRKAVAAAANVHLVPIALSEIRKVASQFPIFFAKDGETGQFYLTALMGLEPHENLHWTGSTIDAHYVPFNLLRLPFFIGGEGEHAVICIDMDSPGIDPLGPCAIVETDGTDSAYMASITAMLGELMSGQTPTREFVDAAVARRLVVEIKLDLRFHNESGAELTGLYGIDELALERQIAEIADFDFVMALAAMILSLEHVAGLVRRKNARLDAEGAWLDSAA